MAHSGCPWGERPPDTCKGRQVHQRPHQMKPRSPSVDEEDDWETDPDYVHDASKQWQGHEISTASIISDLSRSLRGCHLGRPNPQRKVDHTGQRIHNAVSKDSARNCLKDPRGRRRALCPQMHSSPCLGIERTSLFDHNAAEKLDVFFSKKLKAWASDTAPFSDTYENTEALQKDPARPQRMPAQKEHTGTQVAGRRQHRDQGTRARGDGVARYFCSAENNRMAAPCPNPYTQNHRRDALGKAGSSRGPLPRQESSRPWATMSASARILPECRISHVQSCPACQAFNKDWPARKESLYEPCWSPVPEEGRADRQAPHRKERTMPSCPQQATDRFSKVQQWLEKNPMEGPPDLQGKRRHRGDPLPSPENPRVYSAYGSLEKKEVDPWDRTGDAGDGQGLGPTAEVRCGCKSHRGETLECQVPVQLPTCDETSTSPATCSCLFCEQQRPRARIVSSKKMPDPSAEEVAARLEAEKRVSRIVEAFERRSLREAKLAERERAIQAARQRELEKASRVARAQARAGRDRHPGGGRAQRSHPKEEQRTDPRLKPVPEGHPQPSKRKEANRVEKRPSFMDRLRGLY